MVGLSCWQCSAPVSSGSSTRIVASTPLRLGIVVGAARRGHGQHVVAAMQHQIGALHVFEMALQRERLHQLMRVLHRLGAEHPSDVHGEAEIVALGAPHVVHRPDRAVRNHRGQSMLVTAGARGVVAAHARAAHGDALGDRRRRAFPASRCICRSALRCRRG